MDTLLKTRKTYDVAAVREQFPILQRKVHGKPLVYLDNANTTHKPQRVIDAITEFYTEYNSNIHRATHRLGAESTAAFEAARHKVQQFVNAKYPEEIILVRNATEGINLVAQTFGRMQIGEGDEIIVSEMEHHANIVPWQMLCEERGARLQVIPVNDKGELCLDVFKLLLNSRTKLVCIVHISNALGTVNPVEEIIELSHAQGVPVLVDGAQSAYHIPVDVQAMDADFFVFSGHKLYGPTGIGVLYGKRELLEEMPPWQGGGDMIASVSFKKTTYNGLPNKFEAGTPNISGTIGLAAAIDFLDEVGMTNIAAYEAELMLHATNVLSAIPNLTMVGTANRKASVLSFRVGDIHPDDIGLLLDTHGVAIRTGQHCAHPVMQRFGVGSTARASLACYNTHEEIDFFGKALHKVVEKLQ